MSKKMLAAIVLCLFAFVLLAGCSADGADESADTGTAEEAAETEAAEDDLADEDVSTEPAEGMAAFTGSWENPDGSVFRQITFNEDGTADAVNYAGAQTSATWTYEDDYLKVESDAGETWGSSVEWISDTEFKWSYEADTWTKVE